jgi:hypothetical protein
MVVPHAVELDRMPEWSARTEPIAGGVRLVVVAEKPDHSRAGQACMISKTLTGLTQAA